MHYLFSAFRLCFVVIYLLSSSPTLPHSLLLLLLIVVVVVALVLLLFQRANYAQVSREREREEEEAWMGAGMSETRLGDF